MAFAVAIPIISMVESHLGKNGVGFAAQKNLHLFAITYNCKTRAGQGKFLMLKVVETEIMFN